MCYISEKMAKESKTLKKYCSSKGIYYYFNDTDDSIDIISKSGKWKITVNNKNNSIFLYHKNHYEDRISQVPGYHSQKYKSNSLMGYMEYIARHDEYREENPLYESQIKHANSPKGSKNWKKDQRRAEKMRRSRNINYVLELLNRGV